MKVDDGDLLMTDLSVVEVVFGPLGRNVVKLGGGGVMVTIEGEGVGAASWAHNLIKARGAALAEVWLVLGRPG